MVVKAHPHTNQPVAKAVEGMVALAQQKLPQLEEKTRAVEAVEHIAVAIHHCPLIIPALVAQASSSFALHRKEVQT